MTRAALLLVLGTAAAAFALPQPESSFVYTGPMFNPTEALSYGPSDIVTVPTTHSSAHKPAHTSVVTSIRSSVHHSSKSSIATSSHTVVSSPSSASPTPTPIRSTSTEASLPSTTQSVAQVSGTGAAHANYPEYIGALAGGLIAGMVLV